MLRRRGSRLLTTDRSPTQALLQYHFSALSGLPNPGPTQSINWSGSLDSNMSLQQRLLFLDVGPAYQGILSAQGEEDAPDSTSSTPPPLPQTSGGQSPTSENCLLTSSEPTPEGGVDYPFSKSGTANLFVDQAVPGWALSGFDSDGNPILSASITVPGFSIQMNGCSTIPTPSGDQATSDASIVSSLSGGMLTWP